MPPTKRDIIYGFAFYISGSVHVENHRPFQFLLKVVDLLPGETHICTHIPHFVYFRPLLALKIKGPRAKERRQLLKKLEKGKNTYDPLALPEGTQLSILAQGDPRWPSDLQN